MDSSVIRNAEASWAKSKAQVEARRAHIYTHDEIRELLDSATTGGEWHGCKDGECVCGMVWGADGDTLIHINPSFDDADCIPHKHGMAANARLIARAAQIIRQLLAEVEAQANEQG